jgi:hypothetical protein
VLQSLILFDVLADFVTAASWHVNIREHDVREHLCEPGKRLLAVADRDNLHPFIAEGQVNDLLDGD